MMLHEMAASLAICGAKCREGLCERPPERGKRRCFAHGGAPRSGAPKGNANGLKHGFCSGARWRDAPDIDQLLNDLVLTDRTRLRRLRHVARAHIRGDQNPPLHTHQPVATPWDGRQIYSSLLRVLEVDAAIAAGSEARSLTVEMIAEHDVIRALCKNPRAFDSNSTLVDEILRLVVVGDTLRRPIEYRVAWWRTCDSMLASQLFF